MQNKPDINRLIEFHAFLLKFQKVERSIALPGPGERKENDVEHSYFLAMAAWYLAPHFPQIDRDKAIRYALVHDLVETYAGDTNAFGTQEALGSKKEREAAAQKQLEHDWADAPDILEHIHHYELKDSEEAKFVYALDKIMPALVNFLNGGYVWKKYNVDFAGFRAEKEKKIPQDSPLWPYYEQLRDLLMQHPELFPAKD